MTVAEFARVATRALQRAAESRCLAGWQGGASPARPGVDAHRILRGERYPWSPILPCPPRQRSGAANSSTVPRAQLEIRVAASRSFMADRSASTTSPPTRR